VTTLAATLLLRESLSSVALFGVALVTVGMIVSLKASSGRS
jgi:drug/metabolite transporter (DMT)-like permease